MIFIRLAGLSAVGTVAGATVTDLVNGYLAAGFLWASRLMTTAQRFAPVRTGYLRRSPFVTHPSHFSHEAWRIDAGFFAPYAQFVERRRGFMAAALTAEQPGQASFMERHSVEFAARKIGPMQMPAVHATGPLIGPQIHPTMQRRRAASARLARRDLTRGRHE